MTLGTGPTLRVGANGDGDVCAGLAQVECMCVALRAVAQNDDALAFECSEISIGLVIERCHADSSLSLEFSRRNAPWRKCTSVWGFMAPVT